MNEQKQPRLSVIIPTYNRSDILPKCLNALISQDIPLTDYEIIIVDDGSTDDTPKTVETFLKNGDFPVHYIRQPNQGPAAARNTGIRKASGRIVWITGDDYIAEKNCLYEHLQWQEERFPAEETVVLGYSTWHPDLEINDIMYWVENGGPQFYYHTLKHGEEISFFQFITCNISFKRSFFEKYGPFDERYPSAMGEDTDLGLQLALNGMRFYYNSRAVAYHYHPTSEEDSRKRDLLLGEMMVLQEEKWPKLHNFSSYHQEVYRRFVYRLTFILDTALRPAIRGLPLKYRRFILKRIFRIYHFYYKNQGIKKGLENLYRRGKEKPSGECVLVIPCDDMDTFYRHISDVRNDFPAQSIVLLGKDEFCTRVRLKHPSIDWFLLNPGMLKPIVTEPQLAHEIKKLNCRTAVFIEGSPEFDTAAALYLKRCGIKNLYAYNTRGKKIKIDAKEWKRAFTSIRPTIQTTLWAGLGLIQRWIALLLETFMVPVNVLRFLLTRIFYR